ncbi:uncharacterized protein ACDP82_013514 isoform 1-T1 [Pangshura tecta]
MPFLLMTRGKDEESLILQTLSHRVTLTWVKIMACPTYPHRAGWGVGLPTVPYFFVSAQDQELVNAAKKQQEIPLANMKTSKTQSCKNRLAQLRPDPHCGFWVLLQYWFYPGFISG